MSAFHRGARWERTRRAVLERDGYRCQHCGKGGWLEVDHVVPMFRGGALWDSKNMQTLCRACHIAKTQGERKAIPGAREWDQVLKQIGKQSRIS